MALSKGRGKAPRVGWQNTGQQDRLGLAEQSSFAEKELGVLLDTLNVRQQRALAATVSSCTMG